MTGDVTCPDCWGSGYERDTYRAAEWDAADPSNATSLDACQTCAGEGTINPAGTRDFGNPAAALRACRCGALDHEPCQGTDGRGCEIAPRPDPMVPGQLLIRCRWWTCLVGTSWSMVDTAADQRRAERRARDTMAKGGVVRPATVAEVQTWHELLRIGAELRQVTTHGDRLAILATDQLDAVQLGMDLA